MIEVRSACKVYNNSFLAVDDVSFDVEAGEIVAFLGPNGAGKSTMLKMLSTYLPLTGGEIRVKGYDVTRQPLAVRMSIGYLTENSILYQTMRVDKFLRFLGETHWLTKHKLRERFDWVVENCRLETVLHKRIYQCSKGFQRRIATAMALIHDPDVLLLDEPTHGLDPLQVLALRDFIAGLKPGKAILFSSHSFQEVTALCDRILIINNGRLLANGTLEEIAQIADQAPPYDLEKIFAKVILRSNQDQ